MKLKVGKTYMTRHGRFVKLTSEPWEGIFNGEYELDGRKDSLSERYGRWTADCRRWDFLTFRGEFYLPEEDIFMVDSDKARRIAYEMQLKRKQKAYEETV